MNLSLKIFEFFGMHISMNTAQVSENYTMVNFSSFTKKSQKNS